MPHPIVIREEWIYYLFIGAVSTLLIVAMACKSIHPSLTIPDHAVTINGCTYQAYRHTNSRTNTEWVLRHDTACVHTRYHLNHTIYVDTLFVPPMTTTK